MEFNGQRYFHRCSKSKKKRHFHSLFMALIFTNLDTSNIHNTIQFHQNYLINISLCTCLLGLLVICVLLTHDWVAGKYSQPQVAYQFNVVQKPFEYFHSKQFHCNWNVICLYFEHYKLFHVLHYLTPFIMAFDFKFSPFNFQWTCWWHCYGHCQSSRCPIIPMLH